MTYGKGAERGEARADEGDRDDHAQQLDELLAELPDDVPVDGVLATGDPAHVLADEATEDGGVLFGGSRGYGPLRRVLLGSVSRELVSAVPCAVIVHPRSAEAEAPAMARPAEGESAR